MPAFKLLVIPLHLHFLMVLLSYGRFALLNLRLLLVTHIPELQPLLYYFLGSWIEGGHDGDDSSDDDVKFVSLFAISKHICSLVYFSERD